MTTRLWWMVVTVLVGAIVSAGLLARVYVRQQVPPGEVERLVPYGH